MKASTWVLALTAAFLPGTPSCKKEQPQTSARDRYGIGVDWPKLDTEFRDNSDPNVQASVESIKRSILYHQYPQAVAGLDKLSSNPTLNEAQKKLLTDLRDQTQQVMAKAASPQPTP